MTSLVLLLLALFSSSAEQVTGLSYEFWNDASCLQVNSMMH